MERELIGKQNITVNPPASALTQSLRNLGYSFNSAVADIVDNSIAAKASKIDISVDNDDNGLYVVISDDGFGMSHSELLSAMSIGSKNPLEQRRDDDLGRFGMGLKTASFSQATKVSCVTSKGGIKIGAQWDLEKIVDTWTIQLFDRSYCDKLFSAYGNLTKDGTTVIWQNCDRITENIQDKEMKEFQTGNLIRDLREHLSLIFHKFLDGYKEIRLTISVNGLDLQPKDPFCRNTGPNSKIASSLILDEKVKLKEGDIQIRGYTLPHPSKIKTKALLHKLSIDGDYFNNQGFYVYRVNRLLAWGSWFRILPKNESNKLARVELNIPNTMDELWRLDIKKSTVDLPIEIRAQIKEKVKKLGLESKKTFNRRTSLKRPGSKPVWIRVLSADHQNITYQIDRKNEMIKFIKSKSKEDPLALESLISLIELALPIRLIENDLASNLNLGRFERDDIDENVKLRVDSMLAIGLPKELILDCVSKDDSASVEVINSVRRYMEKTSGVD